MQISAINAATTLNGAAERKGKILRDGRRKKEENKNVLREQGSGRAVSRSAKPWLVSFDRTDITRRVLRRRKANGCNDDAPSSIGRRTCNRILPGEPVCVCVRICVYMCACGRDPGVLYTSGLLRARARSLRDLAHRIASRSRSCAKGNGCAHLRFVFISCLCMIAASSNEKKMTVKILRPDSFSFFWNCCFFDALLRFFINGVRSILEVSSYFSGGGRRGQIDRRIHGTPRKCASSHIWDDPQASTLARYLRSVCVAVLCVGRDVARTAR